MKVGDMIKMLTDKHPSAIDSLYGTGLLVRIGTRHNNRPVGTVLTQQGIETWPLDSYYEYEIINESR